MFHARKITDDGRQVTLQYFPNGDWTLPAPCYSLLDDHAVKNIHIVCPNNTVPSTHPQLDIIREKIAMKDNVKLTIEINASISSLCVFLDLLAGTFVNNRYLYMSVKYSRLNHHGGLWETQMVQFIAGTPTLYSLDLGYITQLPECLQEAIISHQSLRKLDVAHDRDQSTDYNSLQEAEANIIAEGNLIDLKVVFDALDVLPDCYVNALTEGNPSLQVLDLAFGTLNQVEVPDKLQRQMKNIVCNTQSVGHLVKSNHNLFTFAPENCIAQNLILVKALDINSHQNNDINWGDDLVMWKIRSKCFLCNGMFERWIIEYGKDYGKDDNGTNNVDTISLLLDKKLHVLEWITKPDGSDGKESLNWMFVFITNHNTHLLSCLGSMPEV